MNQQNHQTYADEEVLDGKTISSAMNRLQSESPVAPPLTSLAGLPASRLFGQGITYTYDDVIFHPGHINFGAHEVCQLSFCKTTMYTQPLPDQACYLNLP